MPPRTALGQPASPPRRQPSVPAQALDAAPRTDSQLAPLDQAGQGQAGYQAGAPIRFYVQRMHDELDKRAQGDRISARRSLRIASRRRKPGVTFTGFFARVAILYLLFAYFFACPNDPSRERAVCRQIDSVSARLRSYEPAVRPYYQTAQRKIRPYALQLQERAQPAVDRLQPYYQQADRFARPKLSASSRFYYSKLQPRLLAVIHKCQNFTHPYVEKAKAQYIKTLQPSVEMYGDDVKKWWAAKVEPHLSRSTSYARQYGTSAYELVSPVYTQGVPLAQHHYRTNLRPFSRRAYHTSRRTYLTHIHPRALTASKHTSTFYRTRILPTLARYWSRFVDPQLAAIRERIYEYRTKKTEREAVERVERKARELAKAKGEDEGEFDDFLQDLRDAKSSVAAAATTATTPDPLDDTAALPVDLPVTASPPPPYSSSVPPPPPSAEESAAHLAEKRTALEALQTAYEQEIAALGQAEQKLLVERLSDIRRLGEDDVRKRFEISLEGLDEEGDRLVGKLGRFFEKVEGDEKKSVEEKVEEAEVLCKKGEEKMRSKAEKVKIEIEEYRRELEEREQQAVKKAGEAVAALVAKAQSELGVGWTWLEDVRAKDWTRYHSLRKAEDNLRASFASLRTGAIKDASHSAHNPYALLDTYHSEPDKLVKTFLQILNKIKIRGQKEIKGEWTGVVPEAQKAYDAVAGKFGAVVSDLKESASSVAGVEKKPTNVAQSVSSLASVAQASASSLAQEALHALPTIEAHHDYIAAAKNAYGDASQNVLRAVGVDPSPTDLRQTAVSLARAASASAAHAYAEASQSALRAVGQEPSPTDLAQSISSVQRVAASSAAAAYSQVMSDYPSSISSALAAATQAVDQAAEDALSSAASLAASAASVVSSLAAPAATLLNPAPVAAALEGAKEKANEFFGEVSQAALSGVGIEPSPTDIKQSASSVAKGVKEGVRSMMDNVESLAAPATEYTASVSSATAQAKASVVAASSAASVKAASAASSAKASKSSVSSSLSSASSSASVKAKSSALSVSSVASSKSSAASKAAAASSKSASSAAGGAASSISSAASQVSAKASSLGQPHPSYAKSAVKEQVVSATDAAKSAAGAVKGKVVGAEGVKASASSLAQPHPSYAKSQVQEKVVKATQGVKEKVAKVVHGEL
ncbi:hypothetical protein JCM11251_006036 [Rhodosporidiobolus azoricus]